MDRVIRLVLVVIALALLSSAAWWRAGPAQQAATPSYVIVLARGNADEDPFVKRFIEAFRERHPDLMAHTKVQAVNLPIDAEPMLVELQGVARLKPALWVAQNGRQALAARRADPRIPLVFTIQADPVALGIASDLMRRAEPTVGLWVNDDLDAKRLEMLIDAYPSMRHFGVIANMEWVRSPHAPRQAMRALASSRGVAVDFLIAASIDEALKAVNSAEFAKVQAWCLPRTGLSLSDRLLDRLATRGQPVMTANPQDVQGKATMAYTFMPGLVAPTLADLTARIIEGEHAGSIPIQMPHRFQFAVRASSDRGWPAPSSAVIRRADLVVK